MGQRRNRVDSLQEKLKQLPPELKTEASDFIDYLLQKIKRKRRSKLKLNWAGGLKEFRDKYTSLELQRKISEWWGD